MTRLPALAVTVALLGWPSAAIAKLAEPDSAPAATTTLVEPAVILLACLLAPLGVVMVLAALRRARPAGWVRIVALPPGEAPPGIRAAWVGLELPLAPGFPGPVTYRTYGVMTGESVGAETGYVVDGRAAVAKLAEWNATAAAWWEEHVPRVLARGHRLMFAEDVCQRIG
jgi:hypothetical protein